MPLSMALLRSETLEHLGLDALDLDPSGGSANLDLLINRSWWDVISQFEFKEEEKIITFVTVAGTRNYSIQTIIGADIFDAIRQLTIANSDGSTDVLDNISIMELQNRYNSNSSSRAKPSAYVHDGGYLYFDPVPDAVYTLTVFYKYILTDLSAGNPAIPQDWHESILYGAVQRGQFRQRDYISSSIVESRQTREIMKRMTTDAKENRNNTMSGVNVMRNPYRVSH